MLGYVRIITVGLALFLACAMAQAPVPLSKVLASELDRNFTALKQKADPAPYFLGYAVSDVETDVVVASQG